MIGGIVKILGVLLEWGLKLFLRRQRHLDDPQTEIDEIRKAVTAGDEDEVQKAWYDWRTRGQIRRPVDPDPGTRLRIFPPPPERDRDPDGDRAA